MIRAIIQLFKRWSGDRRIFRFHNGKRWTYADPVMVHLLLKSHPEYLHRHLAEARTGDLEAINVCVDAARSSFGADDLPKADCVRLLFAFDIWKTVLRDRHDAFCRLAAIHGCDVGSLDPERFTALYFARAESQIRQADTQRLGARAAHAELPRGWFTATRDSPDEAVADYEQHIAAIASAHARAGA
ncbi:hypothetical protein [Rhodopirellula bahusiensis]|uniref:Uncharacterized protein n=1 Tax=Rhodopirellula bahusiensis TaxID=2014065 RepID=A0A2G1W826_9BACT|nr:hypothetical protein [Rhodopirellula bahusiensis]PHQ35173.1 hypothetical protein CEE69_12240 [Rhodopirellula bahusiensis]